MVVAVRARPGLNAVVESDVDVVGCYEPFAGFAELEALPLCE